MSAFQFVSEQLASLSVKSEVADVELWLGLFAKNDSKISLVRRRRILAGAKYVKIIEEEF